MDEVMGITDYDISRGAVAPPTWVEAKMMDIHGIKHLATKHPATKIFLSSRKQRGRELKLEELCKVENKLVIEKSQAAGKTSFKTQQER